jgi:tRNA(Ile)-lysidine synthase
MLKQFLQYCHQEELLPEGAKVLIACSGGVDSTVLCHLFNQAGLPFAIAHCNFQLRGQASDADEAFAQALAEHLHVPFHSTRFDTLSFSKKQKIGIQEAARHLRYEWLEAARQSAGCALIATAHHLDDSIETVLFNFAKGCGIRGMHGILPKKDKLIRPLLFATKKELQDFARQEGIAYREDASNQTDKYSRNLIRRQAVPVFEKLNPNFQHSAGQSIQHLRETESLFAFFLEKTRGELLEKQAGGYRIAFDKLRSYPALPTLLYELLSPFGFNKEQVGQILQSMEHQSGKRFMAGGWRLLSDRFFFFLSQVENAGGVIEIESLPSGPLALPEGALHFQYLPTAPGHFPKNRQTAWLDWDKISWPLRLRRWQPGDVFCPLGMGGQHQKLQDFFSNQKLSLFDKERVWLLESGGEICWIVGQRPDERFKVAQATQSCLKVTFEATTFAPANPS